MKILVAVDRSPESADAASAAKQLFGDDHEYTFVSIAKYETPENGMGIGTNPNMLAIRDQVVDTAIVNATKVAVERAESIDIDEAAIVVEVGPVGPAICEMAEELGTDIIVMGSKERSMWDRIFHSSAGRHVIDNAPCPVLVVR